MKWETSVEAPTLSTCFDYKHILLLFLRKSSMTNSIDCNYSFTRNTQWVEAAGLFLEKWITHFGWSMNYYFGEAWPLSYLTGWRTRPFQYKYIYHQICFSDKTHFHEKLSRKYIILGRLMTQRIPLYFLGRGHPPALPHPK